MYPLANGKYELSIGDVVRVDNVHHDMIGIEYTIEQWKEDGTHLIVESLLDHDDRNRISVIEKDKNERTSLMVDTRNFVLVERKAPISDKFGNSKPTKTKTNHEDVLLLL